MQIIFKLLIFFNMCVDVCSLLLKVIQLAIERAQNKSTQVPLTKSDLQSLPSTPLPAVNEVLFYLLLFIFLLNYV